MMTPYVASFLVLQGLSESDLALLRAGRLPSNAAQWMKRASRRTQLYALIAFVASIVIGVVSVIDHSVALIVLPQVTIGIEIIGAAITFVVSIVLLIRSFSQSSGGRVEALDGPLRPGERSNGSDAYERTLEVGGGLVLGASTHVLISKVHAAIPPNAYGRAYLAGNARILVAIELLPR
jgi:hypothetical protein